MSKIKNIVLCWWNSEIARFKRHPYFWTILTVLACLWIFVDYRSSMNFIDALEKEINPNE